MYVLVAILLLIVLIFGVSSGMQSYASTQQSEAAIEQAKAMQEVAKIGQINAQANFIMILTMALVIVISVALIAAVVWFLYKRSLSQRAGPALSKPLPISVPRERDPLDQILEIEKLRLLRDLRGSNQPQLTDSQPVQQPENDPLYWLK